MIEKPKDDSTHEGPVGRGGPLKAEAFKWSPIKGQAPTVQMLSKAVLYIDRDYQRDCKPSDARVRKIAANFDWNQFAAVSVSKRGNRYMVVDGQNRVLACMKRKEIDLIPCIIQVHQGSDALKQSSEASSFLGINTTSKCVTPFDKHRAGLVAKDANAIATQAAFDLAGVQLVKRAGGPDETNVTREVAKLVKSYGKDFTAQVLGICKNMRFTKGISSRGITGVAYIMHSVVGGPDVRLVERLIGIGGDLAETLMDKGVRVEGKAGPRVVGKALLLEVNKGLRTHRYETK